MRGEGGKGRWEGEASRGDMRARCIHIHTHTCRELPPLQHVTPSTEGGGGAANGVEAIAVNLRGGGRGWEGEGESSGGERR